jgi:chromosome partitioning protein
VATLSIASAKGGVGKTTLCLLLGTELALDGHRVVVLDCDLNQHCAAFAAKAEIHGFSVVPGVDESNILAELRKAEKEADLALIDLPGGSSTLALKALQRSHFVIVPTQTSLPDVRDAVKTVAQIDDAQDLARAPIARALIWTRLLPGFESRAARHVRESVEEREMPMFRASLLERTAYRELHITGRAPRQADPTGKAAANIAAISQELLGRLADLTETT